MLFNPSYFLQDSGIMSEGGFVRENFARISARLSSRFSKFFKL